MKIKIELEIDTHEDQSDIEEMIVLITEFKAKLENFNQDDFDDEEETYEEEVVAENPKPKKRFYRGRRNNS
jgi:hypothetical protein|tara:strand:+ start:232 stop:444 length:213 start_codon:yes stop_codon:yes gene_type:complete